MTNSIKTNNTVTCVSCKHYKLSLFHTIFRVHEGAVCKRTEKIIDRINLVSGKVTRTKLIEHCVTERNKHSELLGGCGTNGIHWVPKRTQDVFKALKKG